jgi:pyruvate/2-oxoglutarate dehydrogenase complex dihydrolipoamide dehydrogenase (E3) component
MSENAALNTDTKNTDVIVIGLGPAGETVGGMLAEAGLDVVGIEGGLVGGECPYWGCVPSKMMIRASNLIAESRRVGELAGSSTTTPDWAPVARRIREQATDNWDDTVAVDRFVGKGGTFVRSYATITGPNSVQVNNTTYVASRGLVIATGTLAAVPPIPGLADTPYWTNHQIVEVELLPKSLIVLGGGAIGTEIAGEKLLVATGRRTFLKELGVEALGLAPAAFLKVDGRQRVAEGLWAAGDIAGDGRFTHLATRQGAIVAADILGEEVEELNLDSLPAVTFTDPEVGAVGLTEAEARAKGLNVRVVTKLVGHTARGWLHSAGNEGFTKLIVDADRGVLVGATSAGPAGGEVLGMLTLAVHAEIPIATLRSMIYAYPTFHKGVEDALNDLE